MVFLPPSYHQSVAKAAVDQLVDAVGEDVAIGGDVQPKLRQVLGRMAPDLLAALLAVEARIVAGTVEGLVGCVIAEGIALVRAECREGHDVAIRTDAALDLVAELDQNAGRILIR